MWTSHTSCDGTVIEARGKRVRKLLLTTKGKNEKVCCGRPKKGEQPLAKVNKIAQ
jgi:hypothetical protein